MTKMLIMRKDTRPIWELNQLICSIIGTCLTLKDLRKIARRCGHKAKEKMTPFEFHHTIVFACQTCGPMAKTVQKYLNEKYWLTVQRLDKLEANELEQAWEEAVHEGEVAAAYWAIATRADAPSSLIKHIFGEVHMMSHLQGAQSRLDLKELAQLRDDYRQLKERLSEREILLARTKWERDEARLQAAEHEGEVMILQREISLLQERLRYLEEGQELQRLKQGNSELRARLTREQDLREKLELYIKVLEDELRQRPGLPRVCEASEPSEMDYPVQPIKECPSLCARRILFVGGLERLEPNYRRLVEEQGGILERHDGNCRNGQQRLEAMIKRADFVICPVDCNSHRACLCVKRLCKDLKKLHIMLSNSGVSSFQKALAQVACEKLISNS